MKHKQSYRTQKRENKLNHKEFNIIQNEKRNSIINSHAQYEQTKENKSQKDKINTNKKDVNHKISNKTRTRKK
jgi:hypothetical protein